MGIFGADLYTQFKEQYPKKELEIQRHFETKKRSIKRPKDANKKITVCSIGKLQKMYKTKMGDDIKTSIRQHPLGNHIDIAAEQLRVDFQTLHNHLFKPCVDNIVRHIKDLVEKSEIRDTKVFLLVGGFSESDIVHSALKSALPNASVLNPPEPGLAVLKGAVIFGHSPIAVSSRIAKYSYGVNISPPFDNRIHPADRRVIIDGQARCKDMFKRYIEKGARLTYGMFFQGKHITVKEYQTEMLLKIYVSSSKNPRFCDEAGTEYAGNLVVKLPRRQNKMVVEVKLIVGETELKVEAKEQESDQIVQAYFDFL